MYVYLYVVFVICGKIFTLGYFEKICEKTNIFLHSYILLCIVCKCMGTYMYTNERLFINCERLKGTMSKS